MYGVIMKISPFKIKAHRLKNVEFALNVNFEPGSKVDFRISIDKQIEKHADKPMAEVSIVVSIFKDMPEAPFMCRITYQGLFSWEEGIPSENVEPYLKCNAAALLYSYVRPLVTQLTAMSNITPLTLPFMNFTDEKEEE